LQKRSGDGGKRTVPDKAKGICRQIRAKFDDFLGIKRAHAGWSFNERSEPYGQEQQRISNAFLGCQPQTSKGIDNSF
jgi:hypothetical protein